MLTTLRNSDVIISKVKVANFSIYTPMEEAEKVFGEEVGLLVFDPRNYTRFWPRHNFTDYKTALLGRYARAVSVAAWDTAAASGFVLTATPSTTRGIQTLPFDPAELLIRLEDFSSNGNAGNVDRSNSSSSSRRSGGGGGSDNGGSGVQPQYFGVLSCTISKPQALLSAGTHTHSIRHAAADAGAYPPANTKLPPQAFCSGVHVKNQLRVTEPAEFFAELLLHITKWTTFHQYDSSEPPAAAAAAVPTASLPLHLKLDDDAGATPPSSEGARLVDMARAVITSSMTEWVGLRPDYGDGTNYWSVSQKDRGSLPLESYALNRGLLLWGHTVEVAERVQWYLETYVENPPTINPSRPQGYCVLPRTPDGGGQCSLSRELVQPAPLDRLC